MKTLLIFVFLITFSSCNESNTSKNLKTTDRTSTPGKVVAKLDPSISAIYQDRKSNYWFGSKENGVFRYNGQVLQQFNREDGLIGNQIRGIQEDRFGNIYIETTEGISQFDGKSFHSLTIDDTSSTVSQWKSGPDDLWFSSGYQRKGPYRFDGKRLYYHEFPKSPLEDSFTEEYPNVSHSPYGIYCIFKDSKGHLWFGTAEMGIYRFDGKTISYLYEKQLTETPNGGAFGIRSIAEDNKGHIWINNTSFKYKIHYDSLLNKNLMPVPYNRLPGVTSKGKETQYYLSIIKDDNENLWMLTFNNGVWKNNGTELTHYPVKKGKTDLKLLSMLKDNKGNLWVGTQGSGIYKFYGKAFKKVEF